MPTASKILGALVMLFRRTMPTRETLRNQHIADLHIRRAIAIKTQQVADNAKAETDELVRKIQETRRDESSR